MKKLLLLLVLTTFLVSFVPHKFYVSVTNINYAEKSSSFQITTRIFIDDMESLLLERYGIKAKLATDQELALANDYIEKYFRSKFTVKINGDYQKYTFLGKKYDTDVVICYLEIESVDKDTLDSIEVQNEILTDLFEEQKNLVHIKVSGTKKSFVLIKENNKGMLNL